MFPFSVIWDDRAGFDTGPREWKTGALFGFVSTPYTGIRAVVLVSDGRFQFPPGGDVIAPDMREA